MRPSTAPKRARIRHVREHACLIACPITLAALCALEAASTKASLSPQLTLLLGALVIVVGAAIGTLWDAAFALLRDRAKAWRVGAWSAVAVALATLSVAELGAVERLGGRYHQLALLVLACALVGAPMLAATLVGMQPSAAHPLGWFATHSRKRFAWMGLLGLAGAGCFVLDRVAYVGLYPQAHAALRAGALGLGTLALAVVGRTLPWRFPTRTAIATTTIAAAAALLVTHQVGAMVGGLSARPWSHLVLQTARWFTDVDLDGYSGVFAGGDCAPFVHAIHPGAREIPGNGIDDNCLLGDAQRPRPKKTRVEPSNAPVPMDIVLITIDALRADHMGVYSNAHGADGLATTPALDAFAREAMVFERAYSPGAWTSIAISSLMRGVYGRRIDWTGLFEADDYQLVRARNLKGLRKMFALPLTDEHEPLARLLAHRKMRTVAVVDDGYSQMLSRQTRAAPGFKRYRLVDKLRKKRRNDAGTAQLAIDELGRIPLTKRFFLWAHFFGPHSPSQKHRGIRLDGSSQVQRYDHEIRYVDRHVGRLLQAVAARGAPTAVFITADHGEEFFKKTRHHGSSVEPEAIRVPLIAKVPGWPRGRAHVPVSLVDLMPTILALTNTPSPDGLDGRSLESLLSDGARKRVVLADTWRFDARGRVVVSASTAIGREGRVVRDAVRNTWTVYAPGRDGDGLPVDPASPQALVRALSQYLEETGEKLDVR